MLLLSWWHFPWKTLLIFIKYSRRCEQLLREIISAQLIINIFTKLLLCCCTHIFPCWGLAFAPIWILLGKIFLSVILVTDVWGEEVKFCFYLIPCAVWTLPAFTGKPDLSALVHLCNQSRLYSGFTLLVCVFVSLSCQQVFTEQCCCQSSHAPPQQGLKIHSSHLPYFTQPTHMS